MSLGIGQHPYQLLHSGRSSFLDVSEGTGTVPTDRFRIYEINRSPWGNALGKSCGWIHIKARTYNNKDIGLGTNLNSILKTRNGLPKPHNKRTYLATISSQVSNVDIEVGRSKRLDVTRVIGTPAAGNLHQLTMQVNHIFATCPLMKVIHILSNYSNIVSLLQLSHKTMALSALIPAPVKTTTFIIDKITELLAKIEKNIKRLTLR